MEERIEVSGDITMGPQLSADGWERLAQEGYKTVINLSTKGELGQVKPDEEEALVQQHGMQYVHYPVSVSALSQKHVDEFLSQVEGVAMPAYVHCRLGQRSGPFALIWHAARRGLSFAHVRKKAQSLGLYWNSPFLPDFIRRSIQRLREAEQAGHEAAA